MSTTELFEAYWEDRGSQLAAQHMADRAVPSEHMTALATAAAEEMTQVDDSKRGRALQALLRGYRAQLAKEV